MTPLVNGLHHVTAISGAAQRNVDFYARLLGLRFVKKTVNFDDPTVYHLYYGDRLGTPGTALTFFPWEHMGRGRAGVGEASLTQFAVPEGSLGFWRERLESAGVPLAGPAAAFGEERLVFEDPDGMKAALVTGAADSPTLWTAAGIDEAHAIRGFHGVTLAVADHAATAQVLTGLLDYREAGREGNARRYVAAGEVPARVVDLVELPGGPSALQGAGSVHHVAFRVADRAAQKEVRARIAGAGLGITPVIDRNYFFSVYFRSPGGVLFEVATDEPGFTVDEPAETLGQALKLPAQHEHLRARLERTLPPLEV
ncbi:MAG TPA: ring-cleaving dioxygenase [Geminicoccaceae bacterium]